MLKTRERVIEKSVAKKIDGTWVVETRRKGGIRPDWRVVGWVICADRQRAYDVRDRLNAEAWRHGKAVGSYTYEQLRG